MAEVKVMAIPLDRKMIMLEALRNHMRLVERRIDAESFEAVKAALRKQRDEVVDTLHLVEKA